MVARRTDRKPSDEVAHLVDKLRPEDFAPSETDEKLTEEQTRAIVNMTHERALLMRRQGLWSPEEEAAFFNGAACVFHACGMGAAIPGLWVFGPPEGVLGVLAREKAQAPVTGPLDAKARKARRASRPFGLDPDAQRRESSRREASTQRRRAPHHGGEPEKTT